MKKEIWKDIKGYEGYYQVSNLGRVKSLDRTIKYKDGRMHKYKGNILKQNLGTTGYYYINLSKDGKVKPRRVHILVAKHFIEGEFEDAVVNHKDKNKTNNNIENLEWCSQKWNIQHSRGWELDQEDRLKEEINELYVLKKKSSIEIAELYNISHTTVQNYLKEMGVSMRKDCLKINTPIKVFQSETNKFIGVFESQSECARKLELNKGNINAVLSGKRKAHKGYYFKYMQDGD